ncbi:MAG: VCBS repeat-containing protein [Candidatus Nanoarchaeia archaeon]|jgi:hypothetical protein
MRKIFILIIIFFLINTSLAELDNNKVDCENAGYEWVPILSPRISSELINAGDRPIYSLAVGDLDGDGDSDFASSNWDNKVYIWINNGDGSFLWELVGTHLSTKIEITDIDDDGDNDIICAGGNKFTLLINNNLVFEPISFDTGISGDIDSLSVGNLNNDNKIDLIIGVNSHVYAFLNEFEPILIDYDFSRILLGVGAGTVNSLAVSDITGDGYLNVISGDGNGEIRLWNKDNEDPFIKIYYPTSDYYYLKIGDLNNIKSLTVSDLNNDGNIDIISGDRSGSIDAWFNSGSNTFSKVYVGEGDDNSYIDDIYSLVSADVNMDGFLDICSGGYGGLLKCWKNNGDETFSSFYPYHFMSKELSRPIHIISFNDFDEDGDIDLLTGDNDGYLYLWRLNGYSGLTPSCCGDDLLNDYFTDMSPNSIPMRVTCFYGVTNPDYSQEVCELMDYQWVSGTIYGSNGPCCGDDITDTFYSDELLCYNGQVSINADLNQDYCEFIGYEWFTGVITGVNGPCCGDDGSLENFFNAEQECFGEASVLWDYKITPESADYSDGICYNDYDNYGVNAFVDDDEDIDCCELTDYYGGSWLGLGGDLDCCGTIDDNWCVANGGCYQGLLSYDSDANQLTCDCLGGTWIGSYGFNYYESFNSITVNSLPSGWADTSTGSNHAYVVNEDLYWHLNVLEVFDNSYLSYGAGRLTFDKEATSGIIYFDLKITNGYGNVNLLDDNGLVLFSLNIVNNIYRASSINNNQWYAIKLIFDKNEGVSVYKNNVLIASDLSMINNEVNALSFSTNILPTSDLYADNIRLSLTMTESFDFTPKCCGGDESDNWVYPGGGSCVNGLWLSEASCVIDSDCPADYCNGNDYVDYSCNIDNQCVSVTDNIIGQCGVQCLSDSNCPSDYYCVQQAGNCRGDDAYTRSFFCDTAYHCYKDEAMGGFDCSCSEESIVWINCNCALFTVDIIIPGTLHVDPVDDNDFCPAFNGFNYQAACWDQVMGTTSCQYGWQNCDGGTNGCESACDQCYKRYLYTGSSYATINTLVCYGDY